MGLFFSPLGAGRKIFKAQPSYHSFTDKRETLVQDLLIDHHSSVSQPLHLPLRSTRHRRSSQDRHSAAGSRLAAPPQIDAAPPGAGSPLLPRSTQRRRAPARRSSPDLRRAINAFRQLLPLLRSMRRRPPGLGVSSPYWWLVSSFSSKSQSIHRSFLLVSKLVSCHCHPDAAIFHWVRLYFVSKKKLSSREK